MKTSALQVIVSWEDNPLRVVAHCPPTSFAFGDGAELVSVREGKVFLLVRPHADGAVATSDDDEPRSFDDLRAWGANEVELPLGARAAVQLGELVFDICHDEIDLPPRPAFPRAPAFWLAMSCLLHVGSLSVQAAVAAEPEPNAETSDSIADLRYMVAVVAKVDEREREREEMERELAEEAWPSTEPRPRRIDGAIRTIPIEGWRHVLAPAVDEPRCGGTNDTLIWAGFDLGMDLTGLPAPEDCCTRRAYEWRGIEDDPVRAEVLGTDTPTARVLPTGIWAYSEGRRAPTRPRSFWGGDGCYEDGVFNGWNRSGWLSSHSPMLRQGQTVVDGKLPTAVVQRIVRQNFGRFRLCFERALVAKPDLAGRVVTKLVIDRRGEVVSASDGGSDVENRDFVRCVVRGFHQLSFPEPEDGQVVTVFYTVVFSPGD